MLVADIAGRTRPRTDPRLGTEHIAWADLMRVAPSAPAIDAVWVCDSADAPRNWLRSLLPSVKVLDDVNVRVFKRGPGRMTARDIDGHRFTVGSGDLDIYLAGFPCNPWSTRGLSQVASK